MKHVDPDHWKRSEALSRIRSLPADVREDIARVIETAEELTDWMPTEDGSICVDDVQATLGALANEIRDPRNPDTPSPKER